MPNSITLGELSSILDAVFPPRIAEEWDNCGLQVGDPQASVSLVHFALDVEPEAIHAAEGGMLVTHHPLLFNKPSQIMADQYPGSMVYAAIRKGVGIYSAHTSFDKLPEGPSTPFLRAAGVEPEAPMLPDSENDMIGLGRMGDAGGLPLHEIVHTIGQTIQKQLGHEPDLRVVATSLDAPIRRVAALGGSGGSLWPQALAAGADLYITGDISHHHAVEAKLAGLALIDIGHYCETLSLSAMADLLAPALRERNIDLSFTFATMQPPWRDWNALLSHRRN